jgi:hypothetical protein
MKNALVILLSALGVAVVAFLVWGLWATRGAGSWTGGSWVLAAIIVGGVLFTGALAGGLMWLAFYSARKGYDDDQVTFDPWKEP